MGKQSATVELFYDGAWNDVSTRTRVAAQITIVRGVANEGAEGPQSAATAALTFDNRDGVMNPRNPVGTLYGKIGQNTPIRISLGTSRRFWGEVNLWNPQKTVDWAGPGSARGDAWTDVEAAGVLRRLGRGVDPPYSALRRVIMQNDPSYYWPLDDTSSALTPVSGLPGGTAMELDPQGLGAQFAQIPGPGGAPGPYPSLIGQDASFGRPAWQAFLDPTRTETGSGWTVEVLFRAEQDGSSTAATTPLLIYTRNHLITFVLDQAANRIVLSGLGIGGAADWSNNIALTNPIDGLWHQYRIVSDESAPAFVSVWRDGVSLGVGGPASGIEGGITRIRVVKESISTTSKLLSMSTGELAIYPRDDIDAVNDTAPAVGGYDGELAADRFARLCGEVGVTGAVVGTENGVAMGPQKPAAVLQLLAEIERTDGGRLYDSRTFLGLEYRVGADLLNQVTAVTLNYRGGQIAPGLTPVVGDEWIRNDVTAANPNGTLGRWEQATGPNNTQAPPAGAGPYTTKIDANVSDPAMLLQLASWRVAKGTFDGVWYATATADLDAAASLAATVGGVDVGDKATLAALAQDDVPGGTVEHLALGYTEVIGSHRRTVAFNLVPAQAYSVGLLDSGGYGYLDCKGSTTNEVLDTTETGVDLAITDNCAWVHTTGDYEITIGGEVMTVTAVGAVSGSFPSRTQTITVVRSVNGVVKSHATGAEVHVLIPFTPYI